MTLTIFRIMVLRLLNNPLELLLIFVVPVAFFSLFAMIFSHGIATGENKKVRVGIVDVGNTELAKELHQVLLENAAIDSHHASHVTDEKEADAFVTRSQANSEFDLLVRVLPREADSDESKSPAIALITDGQNPMALAIVQSILKSFFLQRAAQAKLGELEHRLSRGPREEDQAKKSPFQRTPANRLPRQTDLASATKNRKPDDVFSADPPEFIPQTKPQVIGAENLIKAERREEPPPIPIDLDHELQSSVAEETEEVEFVVQNPQSDNQDNPRVAMYAAGIAVLFLLFSATGNAATLLEEHEAGTLDRILSSRAGLINVVLGKWLAIFVLGCLQITVMFSWAELIFGIHLFDHLPGFCVMTGSTSAATASFAMFLATLSRSRAQLNALSVLMILSMSALGGSMIPRFAMSDRMKEIGKWTFNAWAIDGYQKVFWYQLPIESLETEICVLCGSAVILGFMSFLLSTRWKTA